MGGVACPVCRRDLLVRHCDGQELHQGEANCTWQRCPTCGSVVDNKTGRTAPNLTSQRKPKADQ